ncbi:MULTISPECIES: bifunctional homocysteine S-methyltransferase/methylenetetrahydrofolate reductase [Niallia]|jgi:methionine synthase / methylenetetrahydrofolate reductase(NADPH)|uniref:bifunctional homocysteine S-methyltransferase/methylenetetrahydrofolate reductase n=1 Tax=Niallia TaxID=2837506 RepID=UPI000F4474D3|nr:bifunctional homocysteine S-methyltransferase/methylenetetrahydrofolate reductase [Niallia circulans]AYV66427.1 bifunctional homocysteine S-methyltransferase/methylenetetrahydrofolate reductase [Niallia circulans]AYV70755.1 bifunctional homocysteine S-methyltransferase/methylenetetrahydrofolate reductase [Niallia circulans]NRG26746.1 bifunctional homocysteine S-methyltransferase/methylenetetrahydrofolate reductase [Niallia circulans]QJX62317.1 bifunctional homocysteine S-methyltransferase/me
MNFLDRLKNEILIGDGAMGTLLYSYGKDTCFESLNLSHPEQIEQVHQAYIHAGADIIQTNTYAANYLKLQRYGLEDNVKEINSAAVKIAKKAVENKNVNVLGTIGGNRGMKPQAISLEELKRSFREQLYCLLLEDVDGILLETFYDLEELETVLEITKKETDIPVLAQLSIHEIGILQNQISLASAFDRLENLGADIIGLNCRLGPHHMIASLEQIPLPRNAYLSAFPNASLPSYIDGKFEYKDNAEYFQRSAEEFRKQGVRLLGGCCGTTPEHIRNFAKVLKDASPITEKTIETNKAVVDSILEHSPPPRDYTPLEEIVKTRASVIVELDPPRKLDTTRFFEGAKKLKEEGIDALTLADNSLASARISNTAIATLVKQNIGLRPLVHIACRDRNIIGLQSHLMGLHTLGIHDVLAITGDPARVGDFPGASSVYDMTSFDLISMIKQLNEGLSFSGKNLGQKTTFSVSAAFNPNVRQVEKAVKRLEKKIECGADYIITQPVYSEQKIIELYEATKHIDTPIYIGLMPLTSSNNAEFLHNEVPGIKIDDSIRRTMAQFKDNPVQAAQQGLKITKSLIDTAANYFNGIYLITPFLRYELSVELARYTKLRTAALRRTTDATNFIS